MAAFGYVRDFGRRINIGVNGRVVIRTWSILEWCSVRPFFPWNFGARSFAGKPTENNIGGERLVRGAANDTDAVYGPFS